MMFVAFIMAPVPVTLVESVNSNSESMGRSSPAEILMSAFYWPKKVLTTC